MIYDDDFWEEKKMREREADEADHYGELLEQERLCIEREQQIEADEADYYGELLEQERLYAEQEHCEFE